MYALAVSPAQRPKRDRPTSPTEAMNVSASPHQNLFIGTSGWAYPTWKPGFYPAKLPQRSFLSFYSEHLTGVEVNYTFRTLPTAAMLAGWLEAAAPPFRFSFKAPQRITHFSRLRNCASQVDQFLAALEPARSAGRLGVVLFQLPPNLKADLPLLVDFLALPPFHTASAPRLAFEFRHVSWMEEPVFAALRSSNAALCIAHAGDDPEALTTPEIHTAAGHTYYRLRRPGGYTAAELRAYAKTFHRLAQEREVYISLRHEDEPTGAHNAAALLASIARGKT